MLLRAYAIGFLGAVSALLLAAVIWFGMQWTEKDRLVWGGAVYTSKQEFNGYLKSKGLSYKTWLVRNPGVAPWEPATKKAFKPPVRKELRSAAPSTTAEGGSDWLTRFLLATNGFLLLGLAVLGALLVRSRKHSSVIVRTAMGSLAGYGPGAPQRGAESVRSSEALASSRRLGLVAFSRMGRFALSLPRYAERLSANARADARMLRALTREWGIGGGDMAFYLFAILGALVCGVAVALFLS